MSAVAGTRVVGASRWVRNGSAKVQSPSSILLLCAAVLAMWASVAQGQRLGEAKGFRLAEPYGPPYEGQIKSLLEAAKGLPLEGGKRILLTDMKVTTFDETNNPVLVIKAPQCRYDAASQSASSPGRLQVQTADGKFSIEGEGFLWVQPNSSLVISNSVRTEIQQELLEPGAATPRGQAPAAAAPGIVIVSDEFAYSEHDGLGTYRGHVRATGTSLVLTGKTLKVKLPGGEAGKPSRMQSITAEEEVTVDYSGVHTTGERAVYSPDTGLVRVSGQPTWRAEEGEGRGDELEIDRAARIFRAVGQAWFRMPSQGAGSGGFLARGNAAPGARPEATNEFIEVRCADYEFRTNRAVFRDQVRVKRLAGTEEQGKMNCELMTLGFTGTNEFQTLVAEEQVVIEQEDKQFTGRKAVYTATNGLLELTGNPGWRAGQREGRGDVVLVSAQGEEMGVVGNAFMRLPADELGETGAPGQPRLKSGSKSFAEIYCREYTVQRENAVFEKNVRVVHPQMNWTCERLTATSPREGVPVERIIAERGVAFDLTDADGRKVHGTGERAVNTYEVAGAVTNDLVRLTGNPARLAWTNAEDHTIVENRILILDHVKNTLVATGGRYAIHGLVKPGGTNPSQPAKNKLAN
jgi:lipopolysaccharide export system protein LptA